MTEPDWAAKRRREYKKEQTKKEEKKTRQKPNPRKAENTK